MARVCAHCGDLYPEERLNCPGCGADADLTFTEGEYDPDLGHFADDDEEYEETLAREGLGEKTGGEPRGGCALLLLLATGTLLLLL